MESLGSWIIQKPAGSQSLPSLVLYMCCNKSLKLLPWQLVTIVGAGFVSLFLQQRLYRQEMKGLCIIPQVPIIMLPHKTIKKNYKLEL